MSRQAAFDDDDVFAVIDGNSGEEEERDLAERDRVNGRILVVFETQFGFQAGHVIDRCFDVTRDVHLFHLRGKWGRKDRGGDHVVKRKTSKT